MVPAPLRVALTGALNLVLVVLLLVGQAPGWTRPAAASTPLPTSAAHPYSDPTWFPLRVPTRIGCARSGCGTPADHGYDAIDLLGAQGDPVYAAGAGIVHVGDTSGDCSSTGEVDGGRWVWVDHGAGVVSRYHHLDSITVTDGQLVTPATRIGTMGHSGDVPPCTVSYLHFEVRHGGLHGERVDLGSLRGCGANGPLQLPQALGFHSWNDRGLHPVPRLSSPALDSRCITDEWGSTAERPAPQVRRADGAVTVSLDAPRGAQSWAVDLEIWRPSVDEWRTLTSVTVPAGTTSTVLTDGVENGRRYRVRTAVHAGHGWSLWSGYQDAVGAPAAPAVRYLQWKRTSSAKKSYLHYGWSRPDDLGSAVTRYAVARRCGATGSTLGSWKTSTYRASTGYTNLRKLKKATVCEVRIQATNAVGPGAWSSPLRVSR